MKISMRKVSAITWAKARDLTDKNVIIVPILILGMTAGLRFLYTSMLDGQPLPDTLLGLVLNLGLSMNITMTGMFVTSAALAQEKEKHTLRALMTSSVNGLEFFLGSILPPLAEMMAVNVALIPLSGLSMSVINLPLYIAVTVIASITSCIIGMIIGIFAKNQMSASTLTTPAMLLFMMVPTFGSLTPMFAKVSSLLFTGVVTDMVTSYVNGVEYSPGAFSVAVLVGEIVLAAGIFMLCYRRNGYETD